MRTLALSLTLATFLVSFQTSIACAMDGPELDGYGLAPQYRRQISMLDTRKVVTVTSPSRSAGAAAVPANRTVATRTGRDCNVYRIINKSDKQAWTPAPSVAKASKKHADVKARRVQAPQTIASRQAVPATPELPPEGVTVGYTAPDFNLLTHDERFFDLTAQRSKRAVVLVFFATWCSPCMNEVPHVIDFVRKTNGMNVDVYGVNVRQGKKVVEKFRRRRHVNYPVLLDESGGVVEQYGVQGIPTVIGIDTNGVIRYRENGMPENAQSFVSMLTSTSVAAATETVGSTETTTVTMAAEADIPRRRSWVASLRDRFAR